MTSNTQERNPDMQNHDDRFISDIFELIPENTKWYMGDEPLKILESLDSNDSFSDIFNLQNSTSNPLIMNNTAENTTWQMDDEPLELLESLDLNDSFSNIFNLQNSTCSSNPLIMDNTSWSNPQSISPENYSTIPNKPYHCHTCVKSYTTKRDFEIHMRDHTGEKPYICTICTEQFKSQRSLIRHADKHMI